MPPIPESLPVPCRVFVTALSPALVTPTCTFPRCAALVSDKVSHLHAFADYLGLRTSAFQETAIHCPCYVLTPSQRERALAAGALPLTKEEHQSLSHYYRLHHPFTPAVL